nr:unnamed protein product [Meloidogyne enterolobii]
MEIPIKAWGYKRIHMNGTNKKAISKCATCQLNCETKGIKAMFEEIKFSKMEICCPPYCFSFEGVKSPKIVTLPKDILLNEHTCSMQLWTTKSNPINKIVVECPSVNICELINCYICTELLANPECWPIYAAIIGGILIAILCTCLFKFCLLLNKICLTIAELVWCLKTTLRILKIVLKLIIKIPYLIIRKIIEARLKNKEQQKNNAKNDIELAEIKIEKQREFKPFIPFRKKFGARGTTINKIVVILAIIHLANGASQFASFSANEEDCTKMENNQTKCHISYETILTLTPSHRIAQLLIRGANKLPMGIVDITIEDIVVECQKSSEYFSRSHEIKTYSSKRCPKQGSCTGNTCANTKLDSKIPELNALSNVWMRISNDLLHFLPLARCRKINQQKQPSYSIRYTPYKQQKNGKNNNNSKTWQCNSKEGYEGFGKEETPN